MASKRRLRRRSCEGKVQHKTEEAARKHAYSLKSVGQYHGYKCNFCKCWHVGRPTKEAKQAYAARQEKR